jgi:hypothetical protein
MAEITDKTKASTNEGQVAGHDYGTRLFNLKISWLKLLIAKKPELLNHKTRQFLARKFGCFERKMPNLFQKQQNNSIRLHL